MVSKLNLYGIGTKFVWFQNQIYMVLEPNLYGFKTKLSSFSTTPPQKKNNNNKSIIRESLVQIWTNKSGLTNRYCVEVCFRGFFINPVAPTTTINGYFFQ